MIDARELRLGNYVLDSGGKVLRIDFFEHLQSGYDCKFGQRMFVASEEVHPMTDYTDSANPIPLTEQWLIDFGFGKVQNIYQRHNQILLDPESNGSYKVKFWTHSISRAEPLYQSNLAIRYVHQLQNLYFALTGKELTKR